MQNRKYIYVISCFILTCGCYKEKQVSSNEVIISMTGNQSSIPADGISKRLITIEIPSITADANNSIALITTKGVFDMVDKNTTTVTAQNVIINGTLHKIASVNLISSINEGIAYVTAAIKNYNQVDTIIFTKAYAEEIKIFVDKLNYQVSNTGEVVVTIKINRLFGDGSPTSYQAITLTALDSTQNPVGRFRNFSTITDASGSCVNYFSIPVANPYTGKIKLLATVQKNSAGDIIADSTIITSY
jgi:hypothetical protein